MEERPVRQPRPVPACHRPRPPVSGPQSQRDLPSPAPDPPQRQSLADAARPEDLFRGQWQYNRTSALDEYKPYLDERWNEGCANAWKLWEEIIPLGYPGSYGIVSAYIRTTFIHFDERQVIRVQTRNNRDNRH
jgi:hypothetical protein